MRDLVAALGTLLAGSAPSPDPAPASVPAAPAPPLAAQAHRAELTRATRLVWGLDAPIAVLAAQVHQESGWNPRAVSPVGAQGMAQFMPATARWICGLPGADLPPGCDTTNPTWALRAMARYDRWLWERLPDNGNACDRWWATLRSYNGGLGHWQKEAALAQPSRDRTSIDAQCGKASRNIKHCPENIGYPHRILLTLQPRYAGWGPGVKCG